MRPHRRRALAHPVLLLLALTAFAVALAPTPALAQYAQTRQGFFFSAGLGYGSMGLGCDDCAGLAREGGVNGYLTLGGTLSPNVRLGVELNGWVRNNHGNVGTLSSLMATAYVYPMTAQGLFVKGGLGYSVLIGDYKVLAQDLATEGGLGLLVGAGYDIPFGGNRALTPYVSYVRGTFNGAGANVVQAGLGLTLH
jgi:hypothetical protein